MQPLPPGLSVLYVLLLIITALSTRALGMNQNYGLYVWSDAFNVDEPHCNGIYPPNKSGDNALCFEHSWQTVQARTKLFASSTLLGRDVGRIFLSNVHHRIKHHGYKDENYTCDTILIQTLEEGRFLGIEVYALFGASDKEFSEQDMVLDVKDFNANCATTMGKFDGVAVNNEHFSKIKDCTDANEGDQVQFLSNLRKTRDNAAPLPLHFSVAWNWDCCWCSEDEYEPRTLTFKGWSKSALEHMIDIADSVDVQVAWNDGSTMARRSFRPYQYWYSHKAGTTPSTAFYVLAYTNPNHDCRISFAPHTAGSTTPTDSCKSGVRTEEGMYAAFDEIKSNMTASTGAIHFMGGVFASGMPGWPRHDGNSAPTPPPHGHLLQPPLTATRSQKPTASPTPSPTLSPTNLPTSLPTLSPTPSPTNSPTRLPTMAPTKSPTQSPTSSPTNTPTVSPTSLPTVSPTKSPTAALTVSPTNSPTALPTTAPTQSPTLSPSEFPTLSPSLSPTLVPTSLPSQYATLFPSSPTASPSTSPSHELQQGYSLYVWSEAFNVDAPECNGVYPENKTGENALCFDHPWETAQARSKLWASCTVRDRQVGRIFMSDMTGRIRNNGYMDGSSSTCDVTLVQTLEEAHALGIEIYALFGVSDGDFSEQDLVGDVNSFNTNCATATGKFDGVAVNNDHFTGIKSCTPGKESDQLQFLIDLQITQRNAAPLPLHFSTRWNWNCCSCSEGDYVPRMLTFNGSSKTALEHMIDIADSIDVQVAWNEGPTMTKRAFRPYQYWSSSKAGTTPSTAFYVLAFTNPNDDCRRSFAPHTKGSTTATDICSNGDRTEAGMYAAFDDINSNMTLSSGAIHFMGGVYSSAMPGWPEHDGSAT